MCGQLTGREASGTGMDPFLSLFVSLTLVHVTVLISSASPADLSGTGILISRSAESVASRNLKIIGYY